MEANIKITGQAFGFHTEAWKQVKLDAEQSRKNPYTRGKKQIVGERINVARSSGTLRDLARLGETFLAEARHFAERRDKATDIGEVSR